MSFFVNTMVCGFSLYQILAFFLIYSCLGWCLEVIYAAVSTGQLVNRGFLNGPVCPIYGFGMIIVLFTLSPLADNLLLLYLGGVILPSVLELVGGWALYKLYHTRWWDYSAMPFNLDGYVCLGASLTWGALGVVVLKWGNPLLLALYSLVPRGIWVVVLLAALVVFCVDLVGTLLAMAGLRYRWHAAAAVENRLANLTVRGGMWILDHVERRMAKAHPALTFVRPKRQQTDTFAAGCSPYKIILLFFIGAFLGDITETIFCRVTGGEWMSRSSVVWGPFSIVWGLAIAMVTQLLYRYKDKPASWLFVMGTLLGGAYEYLCSVFTEVVFGAVFWDYSAIPFNLGGRINLLYCFFWGFAAIAWFKVLFPPISACIEKLPPRGGRVLTWALCIFMAADIAVSSAALVRYNDRLNGVPASNSVEVYLDGHYGNDRMYQVYPKAVHTS